MFCEPYRRPLIDLLAAGEPLPARLAKHVASCAGCSAALVNERRLFAAIESSLGAAANAAIPPSLASRMRAHVTAAPAVGSWRTARLQFASLFLAAGVVAISLAVHWRSMPRDLNTQNPAVAPTAQSAGSREAVGPRLEPAGPGRQPEPRQGRVAVLRQAPSDVPVLVSPEEQYGLEHYIARRRAVALENADGAAVTSDPPFAIKPLEIAVMDSRQLSIEPLESDEHN